jgi:Flp pilus assembly pilin Flp
MSLASEDHLKRLIQSVWHEEDGVLSFEWTIIAVVVVFGIVGGLAAIRDTLIDEMGDLSQAVLAFDQSFSFAGLPALGIPNSSYTDTLGTVVDCGRQPVGSWGIPGRNDVAGGG